MDIGGMSLQCFLHLSQFKNIPEQSNSEQQCVSLLNTLWIMCKCTLKAFTVVKFLSHFIKQVGIVFTLFHKKHEGKLLAWWENVIILKWNND